MNESRALVISIFPQLIAEVKPGLYPGYFTLPAAAPGDFSFLPISDAIYYTETKNDQRQPVTVPYFQLAESIVHDFQENQLGRIIGDETAEPGLFWVEGTENDKKKISLKYREEIAAADVKQTRWFTQLVMIADDTYERTKKHTSVSILQRAAAVRLGLQRPWTIMADSSDKCPYCKFTLPFNAVKCPNCKEIVDPVGYEALTKSLQTLKG